MQTDIINYDYYKSLLPVRRKDIHKGDCGKVFIIAGSVGMTGAACLCSKAAMRCGSGLVTLAAPDCVQPVLASMLLEAMTLPLPSNDGKVSKDAIPIIKDRLKNADVCAIGPGLSNTNELLQIISSVLTESVTCIIDADGLNAISKNPDILKNKACEVILTPHTYEMSRLTGIEPDKIQADRSNTASLFAREYNCTVVLKGHETVIASPNGEIFINKTGNSGMASGGMGDVLTGVIASFAGQGCSPFDAAVLGTFIHGLAGDIAAEKFGEFGLIAGDVVDTLPQAIMKIY